MPAVGGVSPSDPAPKSKQPVASRSKVNYLSPSKVNPQLKRARELHADKLMQYIEAQSRSYRLRKVSELLLEYETTNDVKRLDMALALLLGAASEHLPHTN